MRAAPWLDEAWSFLGEREIAGANHNKKITAFIKEVGHAAHARDETPWCAAFVGACLERSGHASTRSLMARSYLRWGTAAEPGAFGAIAVLSRGRNPAHGHVGFLVGDGRDRIWLLGGNQSNGVTVQRFSRSRLLALRMPERGRPASQAQFETALAHVLEMEGGYANDPFDPGGPTNKGITLAVYAKFKGVRISQGNRERLISELRRISDDDLRAIYHGKYWRPAKCSQLPAALALMHFDTAVNHGVTGAARILQEAVGVAIDGEIGPQTLAGTKRMSVLQILAIYARVREGKYRGMKHFWRFGRGWLNRLGKTLEASRRIAAEERTESGSIPPIQFGDENNVVSEKGANVDKDKMSSEPMNSGDATKWWGNSMTVWGALITAAATVLPTLAPLVGLDVTADAVRAIGTQVVEIVQAVVALGGMLMTIMGRVRADRPLRLARAA